MSADASVLATETPAPDVKPLRLWPAVVIVVGYWLVRLAPLALDLRTFASFLLTSAAGALAILSFAIWWLSRRRVPGRVRLGELAVAVVGGVVAIWLAPRDIGAVPRVLMAVPILLTAWVVWLVATRRADSRVRWRGLAAVLLIVWGATALLRLDGLHGDTSANVRWRWSATAEERYLATLRNGGGGSRSAATVPATTGPVQATAEDWPGFRGTNRDGVAAASAGAGSKGLPVMAWQHPVGPGWSSVAVVGGSAFTQEQRGTREAVVCYDAGTGAERWAHLNDARFEEGLSGPGPRATPTFDGGRVFALGATGVLDCLDAATGRAVWSRDVVADAGIAHRPMWGFSSSPLVTPDGLVVVFASDSQGVDGKVVAYRAASGERAWATVAGKEGYSSPQWARLGGVDQILLACGGALMAFEPAKGGKLWEYGLSAVGMPPSLQPHVVGAGSVLIGSEADGLVMLDVSCGASGWAVTKRWASRVMRPSFNDMVIAEGFAYGFDGGVLCCVDLNDGRRRWRDGHFGHGQLVLLPDRRALLVVAEEGEVILVAATPERFTEVGRVAALEGKTWNHPAVARGRVYVRNGESLACLELGK